MRKLLEVYRHLFEAGAEGTPCPTCKTPMKASFSDTYCPWCDMNDAERAAHERETGDEFKKDADGLTWEEWKKQPEVKAAYYSLFTKASRDFGGPPPKSVTDKWRFWDVSDEGEELWTIFKPLHAFEASVWDPDKDYWFDWSGGFSGYPEEVKRAVKHAEEVWDEPQA